MDLFGPPSGREFTDSSPSFNSFPTSYSASRSTSTRLSTSARVAGSMARSSSISSPSASTMEPPPPGEKVEQPSSRAFVPAMSSPDPTIAGVTPPTLYQPLSPPPSSPSNLHPLARLPPSSRSIFSQISTHVLQHRTILRPHGSPIRINDVSRSAFDAFLAHDRDAPILKRIKLEYDARSCRITMCPPPPPYHDCTPYFLQSALFALRGTGFDTPARQRSLVVREVAFRSSDGSYMVPDAAVVVTPVGSPARVWPTIVVEVANTQGYEAAVAKVKRWFAKSHGMVEVALLLKFTAADPVLDPSCFLEVWRYGVPAPEDQDVTMLEWEGDPIDGGGPLDDCDEPSDVVSTSDDSDRSVDQRSQQVSDINIVAEHDDRENEDFTGDQNDTGIDVADNANIDPNLHENLLAVAENAEPYHVEPEIVPVHAHTELTDSDSSLSSLSEDEPNHTRTGNSTDAASSCSSDASTSAYQPAPRRHKLQMYLSGARQTVLPVMDPVDPGMQHLALRYSDFFGSENVPPGRDAHQEVLLDLDELRLEITLLVGLTEGIEGNVKKRPNEEEQRDGKKARR